MLRRPLRGFFPQIPPTPNPALGVAIMAHGARACLRPPGALGALWDTRACGAERPTSGPPPVGRVRAAGRGLSADAGLEALELGDVVVYCGTPQPPPALRRLQADVAGPFSAGLAAAGQAIVLARRP